MDTANAVDRQGHNTGSALLDLAIIAGVLALGSFVGGFVESPFFGSGVVVVAAIVATILLRRRGRSWRSLGLTRPTSLPKAILWIIGGYFAIAAIYGVLQYLIGRFGGTPPDYSAFRDLPGNLPLLLLWIIPISWGSAAFGEEMVMRGFIMNRLADGFGGTRLAWSMAMLLQAIIFGLLHSYQGWTGVLFVALISLVLGSVYILGGRNLWPCIVIHGVADTLSLVAIYTGQLSV